MTQLNTNNNKQITESEHWFWFNERDGIDPPCFVYHKSKSVISTPKPEFQWEVKEK